MKNNITLTYCVLLMLIFGILHSDAQTSCVEAIQKYQDSENLKNASLSFCIVDNETGAMQYALNEELSLSPASSLKVVTTATALSLLGKDYQFKTQLQYDGIIDASGTLHGNIYIKGFGDPTIGSPEFEGVKSLDEILNDFVAALKKEGIQSLDGLVIGDDSWFSGPLAGRNWIWEDMGNYYGAGAWGLNVHENLYYLYLKQSSTLGNIPPISKTLPVVPGLKFINEVQSAGKGTGDNAYIFGTPHSYTRFIRGTIPVGVANFKIKGSLPDPPFLFAYELLKKMWGSDIYNENFATSMTEFKRNGGKRGDAKTIFTHQSKPLSEIVVRTNMKSVNLYCEALLKTIGKEKGGEGSTEKGIEIVKKFWSDRGVNLDAFFMLDGSGLSPQNAVTTKQMATIMSKIARDNNLYPIFEKSLPVGGKSGALKGMFKGSNAIGKIRAKSGGMTRVRSYTGYLTAASGKSYSFSIIANNFTGSSLEVRRAMEVLLIRMYKCL